MQPAGSARLRVWGFEVYDASLRVAPGFRQRDFERHAFTLDLAYLRSFSAHDIARRSLDEMRRAQDFDAEVGALKAARWQAQLAAVLPSVQAGDRLTGVHRPGQPALFLLNDKALGTVGDSQFSALFFGIWLAPHTSEPALRQALLAGTAP